LQNYYLKAGLIETLTGKEEAMKLGTAMLTAIMLITRPALASSNMEAAGSSVLVILFLGFGAIIIACQLVPSLMLFCSMLKGFFGTTAHDTLPKTGAKTL
jgi:hypothetical protein